MDPGALGAYHINVPLSGKVASECGARQPLATPGRGTGAAGAADVPGVVFTPREHTVLPWWSADAAQLCIKISKVSVEDELAALLGRPTTGDIRFDLDLDLTTAPAASWLATIRLLIEEVDREDGLLERSRSHRSHLERMIMGGLLHTQEHDYLEELLAPTAPARPRTVKRVMDLIESNPEMNYSPVRAGRACGRGCPKSADRVPGGLEHHTDRVPPQGQARAHARRPGCRCRRCDDRGLPVGLQPPGPLRHAVLEGVRGVAVAHAGSGPTPRVRRVPRIIQSAARGPSGSSRLCPPRPWLPLWARRPSCDASTWIPAQLDMDPRDSPSPLRFSYRSARIAAGG